MILLIKGQPLFDNPSMVVYDATGYYEDGSPIICASANTPEEPACRYEAKFIAYGGIVYTITDSEQLLAEVLKIDPQSLFGKTNEQVFNDNIVQKIETVGSQETPTQSETTTTPAETSSEPVATPTTPEPTPAPEPTPTPAPEPLPTPAPEPAPTPVVEPVVETPTPVETSTTTNPTI